MRTSDGSGEDPPEVDDHQHDGGSRGVVPPDQHGGGSRGVVPPDQHGGGSRGVVPPDQHGGGSRGVVPPDQHGGGSRGVVPPDEHGGQRYSWSQLGPGADGGGRRDERGYDAGGHVRLVFPARGTPGQADGSPTGNGRVAGGDGTGPQAARSLHDGANGADGSNGPADIGLLSDADAPTRVYSYRWESTQAGPGWYQHPQETGPVPVVTDEDGQSVVDASGASSVVSSSSVMAVGTLVSRVSGMLRTLVQAWALGAVALSNAYNNANTLPNVVYNLVLGGILTSVIVPLIVSASKREADRGEAYDQRMFTLITCALLGITVVATVAAAPIVDVYRGSITGPELHVMIIFAYFFIPQLFFYGMSSLISAILNSRGSFAAPMWTPVVNNLVVIIVLVLYFGIAGRHAGSMDISSGQVRLLGIGTTIGIVAQTAALVPAMRRVGFRWRPRFDFRRAESAQIGRMAGWMFCYIGATQVVFLVTAIVCNVAATGSNGYTAYTYAWQLFQMPYAVVGISVITALLPRMSAHATEHWYDMVKRDFSAGVRLASVLVVPSALILAVLGPALALVLFAHGRTSLGQAHYMGMVFALFCLGLLPYMMFQLQLRVFYSMHDSRTPALIGLATMTLNIGASFLALGVLPGRDVVAGLGVAFGLANLLGAVLAWRVLSKRLGGLEGRAIGPSLVRMHVAAVPAALFALLVVTVAGILSPGEGRLSSLVIVLVGGAGGLLVYLRFAQLLRVSEVSDVRHTLLARVGRYR